MIEEKWCKGLWSKTCNMIQIEIDRIDRRNHKKVMKNIICNIKPSNDWSPVWQLCQKFEFNSLLGLIKFLHHKWHHPNIFYNSNLRNTCMFLKVHAGHRINFPSNPAQRWESRILATYSIRSNWCFCVYAELLGPFFRGLE